MPPAPRIENFPGVMLAHSYDPKKHNPVGWLSSEKLDGVRAIWNGERLVTRTAVEIFAPVWLKQQLPPGVILDGELFMGRGKFQITSGAVRRNQTDHPHWDSMTYMVFDAPKFMGGIVKRLVEAQKLLAKSKRVQIVTNTIIRDRDHLNEMLKDVLALGGEGLIIRDPMSHWSAIRSWDMLKVKVQDDSDAVVIGYQPGEGKHEGRLGALLCKRRHSGVQFACGTGLSDHDRENPPAIGSIISVGHHGLTDAGVPRFPSFLGVRGESPQ